MLHFVSDRTGWWNLYRWRDGRVEPLCPMEAEFGRPQWVFGMSHLRLRIADGNRLHLSAATAVATWRCSTRDGSHSRRSNCLTRASRSVDAAPAGASCSSAARQRSRSASSARPGHRQVQVLRRSRRSKRRRGLPLRSRRAIEFPTEDGLTAHAFFYPPQNRDFAAPRRASRRCWS